MELYGTARSSASFRVRIALAYKGLTYEASFVSLFNNGFSSQDFPASLVLQHVPELRFRPITRFERLPRALCRLRLTICACLPT